MKQKFNQGGRPPKLNPAAYRYVVRFDAAENGVFLSLFEKSGAVNKATFIKSVLLGKPFKVFVMDGNTREFIDREESDEGPVPSRAGYHRNGKDQPRDCSTRRRIR